MAFTAPSTTCRTDPLRSTASTTRQRRSGHSLSPPNAFLAFRSEFIQSGKAKGVRRQQDVSKLAAATWAAMDESERDVWKRDAEFRRGVHIANRKIAPLDWEECRKNAHGTRKLKSKRKVSHSQLGPGETCWQMDELSDSESKVVCALFY